VRSALHRQPVEITQQSHFVQADDLAFHFKREIGISSIWSVGKLRPKETSEFFFFKAISSSRVLRRYAART
jgi:hypothetical protein